ncbi:MAG: NAD-dependent protein deacetylase [Gammaproteobacteria bacterium]
MNEAIATTRTAGNGNAARARADVARLVEWLAAHRRIVAVTGAGVSTASGIPDYRDENGEWKRQAPMQHSDFVAHASTRRRYWARSFTGWPHMSATVPNAAHRALTRLEETGHVHSVITQNVDGLHQRADSRRVIDLHGRLDRVKCLDCSNAVSRAAWQTSLEAANPDWSARLERIAPDGDADLIDAHYSRFEVPACAVCGGVLMPDVVFYGGAIPPARREEAMATVLASDAVLVVGSSLMVWSAFRLVRAAAESGTSAAAVNRGRTRADHLLAFKVEAECGAALSAAARAFERGQAARRTA